MKYLFFLSVPLIFSCGNRHSINQQSLNYAIHSDTLIIEGKLQDALSSAEKAIELDEDNYIAFNNLGCIKSKLSYPNKEILEAFTHSYKLNPYYITGIANLTNFYFHLKDYSNTILFGKEYLKKSQNKDVLKKEKAHILSLIGESHNYLQSYNDAIEYLTKSLQIEPEDPGCYKERGTAYRLLGKNKEAIDDLNKAISLDSLYHQAYNCRAVYFDDLNLNEKALSDYNKAISIKPDHADYYFNRGMLRIKLKEISVGCRDLFIADSLGSDDAKKYYTKYCK